jgi:hypothetical protein
MEVLAACHIHSIWSYDGSWPLASLADRFQSRGYRVLMMTEHDRGFTARRHAEYREACAQASSDRMLVVPGIEYSDSANRVHVLVWGDVPFLGEGLPTGRVLESVREANGVAVLAHPTRKNAWNCVQPYWTERLLGIELWNRKYDGWAPSKTAPALLGAGNAIPFVGLDFHSWRHAFPLAMALDIPGEVTEQSTLDCLKSRRCDARAFRLPLNGHWFRQALPVLTVAERSRLTAVSIARHSKALTRSD